MTNQHYSIYALVYSVIICNHAIRIVHLFLKRFIVFCEERAQDVSCLLPQRSAGWTVNYKINIDVS